MTETAERLLRTRLRLAIDARNRAQTFDRWRMWQLQVDSLWIQLGIAENPLAAAWDQRTGWANVRRHFEGYELRRAA